MSAAVSEAFPCAVREIENVFIPMPDGCRLAARLWLPADAETRPVPAILEYIPYRKRDFMRLRDEPMHGYYAGHGYAAVRVDLRGSGDSDGVLADEYLAQEQADAVAVIEWLAAQPWCDGNVGMTGISWGGFNALQVAALAPPALKAIITLCASDDRYADDAHYMGGCLLNENQQWGTVLFSINALPPDPDIVGPRWRDLWMQRLEADVPFPALWMRHPHRDDYWRQGSVCEDFSRIRCPVYAIGGWADGYSNAVPRLLAGLTGPRKGLIGPWAHTFPHNGVPGPAIGYLQEALRWWDHWLKGAATGVMDEPVLRVWMQEGVRPEPFHPHRPGRWVAEQDWPVTDGTARRLYLTGAPALEDTPGTETCLSLCSPQTTGLAGGDWCGFGGEGEAPLDQRGDDGRSLSFDTVPLADDLEIHGTPELELRIAVDRPVAFVAVRLNDVSADGASTRVTMGVLNLAHRDGHAAPRALVPGEVIDVRVRLHHIAHRFAAGNVIRVAVSTSYWPMVWPAPLPVTLELHTAASSLLLPVREPRAEDLRLREFEAPQAAPATSSQTPLAPPRFTRTIERDLTTNAVIYRLRSEGGDLESGAAARLEEIGMDLSHVVDRHYTIDETDPSRACTTMSERLVIGRPGWRVRVLARTELTATPEHFVLRASLQASEGNKTVFEREWEEHIPRDLV